jgi:hypothetical protein
MSSRSDAIANEWPLHHFEAMFERLGCRAGERPIAVRPPAARTSVGSAISNRLMEVRTRSQLRRGRRHCADHRMAPIRRSRFGSITAIIDTLIPLSGRGHQLRSTLEFPVSVKSARH